MDNFPKLTFNFVTRVKFEMEQMGTLFANHYPLVLYNVAVVVLLLLLEFGIT